ncbi:MAG TPA: MalY/PatB family protein [Anaerolineales bacterium]
MRYNFDREINRRNTNSIKWEFVQSEKGVFQLEKTDRYFGRNRMLPLWIADMDFQSPQPVVDALVKRARHGVYGYTQKTDAYFEAVVGWMNKRHGWKIKPELIVTTPGVVSALAMLVLTFVAPDEKILIQPPVYYPFTLVAELNGRGIARNPLRYVDGRYEIDFDDLAAKARDPKVRMLILCSPHNPVGRVWTKKELTRIGEICLENNVLVATDEIHGDLVYKGSTFVPFASINKNFAEISITCTAPSKSFNLAGLSTSNIIIPDAALRGKFQETLLHNALLDVGIFGSLALETAYTQGADWLKQVLAYLAGNLKYMEAYFARHIPRIRVVHAEGTYLVWLDCRGLGLPQEEIKRLMLQEARVYLEEGTIFGAEGEGFERVNIACPRPVLKDALRRIRDAVDRLG